MKFQLIAAISIVMAFAPATCPGQQTSDAQAQLRGQQESDRLARLGMMRVMFKGFDDAINPETKQKESVCYLSFLDLPIPKQPMLLRRGDKIAGYVIGTFSRREPRIAANDGVVPGTSPTLEIIHEDTGEKYILEQGRFHVVNRDR